MTARPTSQHFSIRAFVFAFALLLASALGTGTTSAGVLVPAIDMGAPGGGGGGAATTTETVDLANSTIPGIREF